MDDLALLTEVFREELDDPKLVIGRATVQDDIETWDSLAHVRIITSVEERFGFEFSLDDIENSMSVAQLLDIIVANKA